MKRSITMFGLLAFVATPAAAQKLGKGGIGINENTEVPHCARSLGTIAVVEDALLAEPLRVSLRVSLL